LAKRNFYIKLILCLVVKLMKNIELKILLSNFRHISAILKKMGAKFKSRLSQIDTYYNCKNGRLKLREINGKNFELIFYQRPDTKKSKISDYNVLKFNRSNIEDIKNILTRAMGENVTVKKERNLWIYKNTRIHLDDVNKLGKFLELETVIDGINLINAKKEHEKVIKLLNIAQCKKIKKSYSDLLLNKNL